MSLGIRTVVRLRLCVLPTVAWNGSRSQGSVSEGSVFRTHYLGPLPLTHVARCSPHRDAVAIGDPPFSYPSNGPLLQLKPSKAS